MTSIIESRRFLVWYGLIFLVVVLLNVLAFTIEKPMNPNQLWDSPVNLGLFPMFFVWIAALQHSLDRKRFGWFVLVLCFNFFGAYFYAHAIAKSSWDHG